MSSPEITKLLAAARDRSPGAADKLVSAVYRRLRELASAYMRQQAPEHTLQPTALINEAYLKLFEGQPVVWQDREHFFAAAAEAMRRILIDRARSKKRQKRGGGRKRLDLTAATVTIDAVPDDMLDLDAALTKLAAEDPVKAQLVNFRFFAGMTMKEAADFLDISTSTADRYWSYARAFLYTEIHDTGDGRESE